MCRETCSSNGVIFCVEREDVDADGRAPGLRA